MTIKTIPFAAHTAHLDPVTGNGLLVLPDEDSDMRATAVSDRTISIDGEDRTILDCQSLYEADWGHVIRELDRLGFEPSEADDGGWIEDEPTSSGRLVIGLYGRTPFGGDPTIEECGRAFAELRAAVDEYRS